MSGILGENMAKSHSIKRTKDTSKAWIRWNTTGYGVRASFNVSSVVENETGKTTINFATPMHSITYAISFSSITQSGDAGHSVNTTNVTTANYSHHYREQGGTARNGEFRSCVWGV